MATPQILFRPIFARHHARIGLVTITALYASANIYSYLTYLSPIWGYQGFPPFNPATGTAPLTLALAASLAFSTFYPIKISCYSRFVTWFIFYFIYIPTAIIIAMQGIPSDNGHLLLTTLTLSFLCVAYIPELAPHKSEPNDTYLSQLPRGRRLPAHQTKRRQAVEISVITVFFVFLTALLVFFSDIIAIVSPTDVYTQREIAADYSPNRSVASYGLQWLIRGIAPFMIALGISQRKPVMLSLGCVGMLAGFFVSGSKFILFLIPLMYGMHRFFLRRQRLMANDLALLLSSILIAVLLLIEIYGEEVQGVVGLLLSQVAKRAFAVNGMTLGNYYDFFINSNHPFTMYSHLGPVSWFIDYPYGDLSIGQVIGHFQAGDYSYDMSAGFWSTDGIAAAGYVGVLAIGLVLGALLIAFNVWSRRIDLRLLCLSSVGCVWMLADTSVFRVVISGAWPLHFLLVALYSRPAAPPLRTEAPSP